LRQRLESRLSDWIADLALKHRRAPDRAGVQRLSTSTDKTCGFTIDSNSFRRMAQKFDIFNRAQWDPTVQSARSKTFFQSHRVLKNEWNKRGSGFGQRDYALRNAAWHVTDLLAEQREKEDRHEGFSDVLTSLRPGPEEKLPIGNPDEAAADIKIVAKAFGASVVGITKYDPRWQYKSKFTRFDNVERPNALLPEQETPRGEAYDSSKEDIFRDGHLELEGQKSPLPNVIVVGTGMNPGLMETVPSALSGAAVGMGYSHDAITLLTVSQYIRNLGFRAVPSMNDTANAIPYAIQAGLGEYGRNGLLITPRLGPRLRLGKVFTDMPLSHDSPVKFGVKEFCQECNLCANACPAKAISFHPTGEEIEVHNASNVQGIAKWTTNAEKCFSYWTKINTDCSVCIRVCPYNRGQGMLDVAWRVLAGKPAFRSLMLRLDGTSGRGKKTRPARWWDSRRAEVAP